MDEQLARQDSPLAASLDRFVCVRLVQGYGLDLNLFQFDYELTFAAFLLNADGAIYARYGSRFSHEGEEAISLPGFGAALDAACELHRGYPQNRALLAGKRGPKRTPDRPEALPHLPGAKAKADGSRGRCIHCHQVNEAALYELRAHGGVASDRMLWPYPNPKALGLTFDPKSAATLVDVEANSAGAEAHLKPGDRIVEANGQAICSLADFQWVLENAVEPSQVALEVVDRSGAKAKRSLPLTNGWRRRDDFTWRTLSWPMRLRLAGFRTKASSADVRERLNVGPRDMAFEVAELPPGWLKERNAAPLQAGLKKGDILVGVDGKRDLLREADLLAYLMQQKRPGDEVEYSVRRGAEARTIRAKVK